MIFDGLDITGSLSSEFKDDVLGRNREKTIQGLLKILWQFPFPDRAILRVHWLESDKVEFDKDDQLIMELIARVLSAKNKAGAKLPVGRLIIGHTYQVTRLGTSAREKLLSFLTEVVLMKKKLRLEFNVNRESNRYLWNNDVPVDYQNLIRLRTKLLEKVPAGSGVTVDITEGSDGRAVLFREQHPLMSEVEHFKNKKSFLRFVNSKKPKTTAMHSQLEEALKRGALEEANPPSPFSTGSPRAYSSESESEDTEAVIVVNDLKNKRTEDDWASVVDPLLHGKRFDLRKATWEKKDGVIKKKYIPLLFSILRKLNVFAEYEFVVSTKINKTISKMTKPGTYKLVLENLIKSTDGKELALNELQQVFALFQLLSQKSVADLEAIAQGLAEVDDGSLNVSELLIRVSGWNKMLSRGY